MMKTGEMAFTVALFIQGAMLLTSYVTDICSWEAWIPALAAFLLAFLLYLIYFKISDKYPGQHILEINRTVFGKGAGDIISWVYAFFFLNWACFNQYSISSFFVGYVMPETPNVVFLIMFVFICSRAVRLGIENITKLSVFIFILIAFFIVLNSVLLLYQMKPDNFLPLFDHRFKDYFRAAHTELMKPFGETIVFLMFADKLKTHNFKKALLSGLLIGGTMLILVIIRSIAVLGVTVSISNVPSYEVLRLINIKNMLTRIETVYSFLLLIMGFFKVSVIYCALVRAASYLLGLKNEKNIINVIGALMVCYASISFTSGFDSLKWGTKYAALFATPPVLILPLILLMISFIKRKREEI